MSGRESLECGANPYSRISEKLRKTCLTKNLGKIETSKMFAITNVCIYFTSMNLCHYGLATILKSIQAYSIFAVI